MADDSDGSINPDRDPDPGPNPESDRDPGSSPDRDPAAVLPWMEPADREDGDGVKPGIDSPRSPGGDPAGPVSADDPDGVDVPPLIQYIGRGGEYLAGLSVLLALGGVTAISLGIQPYGNVATVASIAGGSVAMVAGMAFQAYVSDAMLPR